MEFLFDAQAAEETEAEEMSHTLLAICIAMAFAVTMALVTIIEARKEGYRK